MINNVLFSLLKEIKLKLFKGFLQESMGHAHVKWIIIFKIEDDCFIFFSHRFLWEILSSAFLLHFYHHFYLLHVLSSVGCQGIRRRRFISRFWFTTNPCYTFWPSWHTRQISNNNFFCLNLRNYLCILFFSFFLTCLFIHLLMLGPQ